MKSYPKAIISPNRARKEAYLQASNSIRRFLTGAAQWFVKYCIWSLSTPPS